MCSIENMGIQVHYCAIVYKYEVNEGYVVRTLVYIYKYRY